MSAIERLCDAYKRLLALPWPPTTSGPERVWIALYAPTQERRLRLRLDEFATATYASGREWQQIDLTNAFARWMGGHRYRDAYFAKPSAMAMAMSGFAESLRADVITQLDHADERTVVAISGTASLFGLVSVSALIEGVASHVQGRLLVFFPGQRIGNNYRLLDGHDGWNYLATPIEAAEGA